VRRRILLGAAIGGAVGIALAASAALAWARGELRRPYAGWDGPAAVVEIGRGMSAEAAIRALADAGVVRRPGLVAWWVRWTGAAGALQAGEYRFDTPASAAAVVGRIRAGDVFLHPLTLPEGLSLDEVAARVAQAGFADVADAVRTFRDPMPVRAFDPDAPDLEGYLFPDTYHFARGTSADEIALVLVGRFLEVVGEDYADRARRVGLTPREAVTLASMIEKETGVASERATVSRVFHNRLARGMKMQCDPTVIYALRREGHEVGRLRRDHLRFESPWNTYVAKALPPGPICSPGVASLEAAVVPAEGDELYFVASPDGGHVFSRTLAEHQRAQAVWRDYVRSSR